MKGALAPALTLPALALLWAPILARYADRPPPGHTGGFDEPTCARCHFDQPVDDGRGWLVLQGVPDTYTPGESYPLRVVLSRPALQRGGFQLAARFATGGSQGRQAGLLHAAARSEITVLRGVAYAHHTEAGTEPVAPDTAGWEVTWTAPREQGGEVAFHLVGNAANGDASEFGDHIYRHTARSAPLR